jgi:hypothetical protein
MLVCPDHHALIDDLLPDEHTVERLVDMRARHLDHAAAIEWSDEAALSRFTILAFEVSGYRPPSQEIDFPIADYDDLTASQLLPLLPQLYADEIEVVEARERATHARPELLERLAELRIQNRPDGGTP